MVVHLQAEPPPPPVQGGVSISRPRCHKDLHPAHVLRSRLLDYELSQAPEERARMALPVASGVGCDQVDVKDKPRLCGDEQEATRDSADNAAAADDAAVVVCSGQ